jgi:hypothetical protein
MKRTSTSRRSDSTRASTTHARTPLLLTIGPDDSLEIGPILRRIHREQPRALLVWLDSSDAATRGELIGELRRRRPSLPLLALTSEPHARLEQVARIAGASFYLPMTCADDQRLLSQTLLTLGIECIDPPIPREPPREHSPPTTRGSPSPPNDASDTKHEREILSGDQS